MSDVLLLRLHSHVCCGWYMTSGKFLIWPCLNITMKSLLKKFKLEQLNAECLTRAFLTTFCVATMIFFLEKLFAEADLLDAKIKGFWMMGDMRKGTVFYYHSRHLKVHLEQFVALSFLREVGYLHSELTLSFVSQRPYRIKNNVKFLELGQYRFKSVVVFNSRCLSFSFIVSAREFFYASVLINRVVCSSLNVLLWVGRLPLCRCGNRLLRTRFVLEVPHRL